MTRILVLLTALTALLVASPAGAYWEYGHQTIAQIAWANIKPTTRTRVLALLRQQALLGTPECKAGTIDDAAIWADCIKGIKNPDGTQKFGNTSAWHYQDVNICQPFDLIEACKDDNCVSAQIVRDAKILADRRAPTADRVRALVFLIHFVGDLHQPLHAGEKGDKGGNDVKADYGTYTASRLNLHSIWDGYLAERAISTRPSLVRRYPAAERGQIAAGSVTDWSRESWQVAHDATYATAVGGDPCGPTPTRAKLDNATIERLVPTVRLEVKRGGLRLTKMLDQALG
ncbi:hypothetical protein FPZ24_13730 [Sphingomonas panacisoli]|uniref:S1/P1 Nuclease n=1 Tax=Sphingomonas panacisoli TaxID=1813879 RepID=A0A5B8LKF5_9SPHN|nr:S1/P1 nuclease [Sphingomonas panacisoli]QDZ08399.1 hypothetical protein FPZ24_13730 [Sphingomonas panacisoli]